MSNNQQPEVSAEAERAANDLIKARGHLRATHWERERVQRAIDLATEKLMEEIASLQFINSCLVNEHADHEKDYLAVWRLIKKPEETVVMAAERLVKERDQLRAQLAVLEKQRSDG